MSISTPRVVNLGRIGLLCASAIALSACVYGGPYDGYYHHRYGYYGAYYDRDPCSFDDSYCGYPVYDGGIFVGSAWYGGRHRYRDHDGRREYWVRGGWHRGEIEGGRGHYYRHRY